MPAEVPSSIPSNGHGCFIIPVLYGARRLPCEKTSQEEIPRTEAIKDRERVSPSFLALLLSLFSSSPLLLGEPTLDQRITTDIIDEPEPRRAKMNPTIPPRNNNNHIPHIHQL